MGFLSSAFFLFFSFFYCCFHTFRSIWCGLIVANTQIFIYVHLVVSAALKHTFFRLLQLRWKMLNYYYTLRTLPIDFGTSPVAIIKKQRISLALGAWVRTLCVCVFLRCVYINVCVIWNHEQFMWNGLMSLRGKAMVLDSDLWSKMLARFKLSSIMRQAWLFLGTVKYNYINCINYEVI